MFIGMTPKQGPPNILSITRGVFWGIHANLEDFPL